MTSLFSSIPLWITLSFISNWLIGFAIIGYIWTRSRRFQHILTIIENMPASPTGKILFAFMLRLLLPVFWIVPLGSYLYVKRRSYD